VVLFPIFWMFRLPMSTTFPLTLRHTLGTPSLTATSRLILLPAYLANLRWISSYRILQCFPHFIVRLPPLE
jgi:hypothetical protein